MEKDTVYKFKKLSSLAKVFPKQEPIEQIECNKLTALKGETVSFQVAFTFDFRQSRLADVKVISPIADAITVREVKLVPNHLPTNQIADDNYIQTQPGLTPDLLTTLEDNKVMFVQGQWRALWIDVEVRDDMEVGTFPIEIEFKGVANQEVIGKVTQNITIYDAKLPEQTLIRTEWFHADCLAEYYKVPVFSKEHWIVLERFIGLAVKRGCNMILTPQFTPPLDTAKGYERTTTQLVDITVVDGSYSFDFTNLKRWIDMCQKVGMKYFEMSHLFTQWGAIAAPKIMATIDGTYDKLFGWETKATSPEYTEFLHTYLGELLPKLEEWNIAKETYFHISDEPLLDQLDTYTAAKDSVSEILKDYEIMDALSDYEFYKTGAVPRPVCANNHIHTFIENGVKNLWSYYCTAQDREVSNRFCGMPSARNRIYGIQVYKYGMEGILHWGYNFYNGQDSYFKIDPYQEMCAGSTYPGGDPFLVYPGADGHPEESIRIMVHDEAMADVRALQMLESYIGKEKVIELLEEDLEEEITFKVYPKSDAYIINMRNKINKLIAQYAK